MPEPDHDILRRFIAHFDPDAESQVKEPPREIAELLKRYARGLAGAAESGRATALLKEHPEWLRFVSRASERQS